MNLSEHFTLEEATFSDTAIRLGIDNQPSPKQLGNMQISAQGMEEVRRLLGGLGIKVNSWIRQPALNEAIGGAKVSAHMDGWAIDFLCPSFGDPLTVCKAIEQSEIKFDQLIHEYGRWTHISFAPECRMQKMTIFAPQKKYVVGIYSEEEYKKLV